MHPRPLPEHERLLPLVGAWDLEILSWSKPAEPPGKSRGFALIEPLFGGLFLQEKVEGLVGENPFAGLGWYGFDPQSRRYQSARIASTSAQREDESGNWDEKLGALVLESAPGAPGLRTRTVLRAEGKDRLTLQRFALPAIGEPWLCAELRYTRRKE